ncbi:MAG: hypothetical protein ACK5XB_19485, partial [Rhodospirillales bacterium]
LRHKHFDLPQLRDDLLGAMSFSGHLPGFLSKLIISISLAQENPVRSKMPPISAEATLFSRRMHAISWTNFLIRCSKIRRARRRS